MTAPRTAQVLVPRANQSTAPRKESRKSVIGDPLATLRRARAERENLVPSKKINTLFTPHQLVGQQDNNSAAFNQKYEGAVFKVKGRVVNIMDASYPFPKAQFLIKEDGDKNIYSPYMVACVVDNPGEIMNVIKGDIVAVQGRYKRNLMSQLLILHQCKVIDKL
jgi:hypothetical protein